MLNDVDNNDSDDSDNNDGGNDGYDNMITLTMTTSTTMMMAKIMMTMVMHLTSHQERMRTNTHAYTQTLRKLIIGRTRQSREQSRASLGAFFIAEKVFLALVSLTYTCTSSAQLLIDGGKT